MELCLHLHRLGKVYKLSKWIPHEPLMPANKLTVCFLAKKLLLDYLLICDEKQILYSNQNRSHHWLNYYQLMLCHRPQSPTSISRKFYCEYGRLQLELFTMNYHLTRPLLRIFTMSNYNVFHESLLKKQPVLIKHKDILFVYDNARPHVL